MRLSGCKLQKENSSNKLTDMPACRLSIGSDLELRKLTANRFVILRLCCRSAYIEYNVNMDI